MDVNERERPPALVVLDTNAVFDWLLFKDPAMGPLGAAIQSGAVTWVGTQEMANEQDHVIARGDLGERGAMASDLVTARDAWMRIVPAPAAFAPGMRTYLRCSDEDDQMFIDFAIHLSATWLVTRDRALLRLARRALTLGVSVVEPRSWAFTRACERAEASAFTQLSRS